MSARNVLVPYLLKTGIKVSILLRFELYNFPKYIPVLMQPVEVYTKSTESSLHQKSLQYLALTGLLGIYFDKDVRVEFSFDSQLCFLR